MGEHEHALPISAPGRVCKRVFLTCGLSRTSCRLTSAVTLDVRCVSSMNEVDVAAAGGAVVAAVDAEDGRPCAVDVDIADAGLRGEADLGRGWMTARLFRSSSSSRCALRRAPPWTSTKSLSSWAAEAIEAASYTPTL